MPNLSSPIRAALALFLAVTLAGAGALAVHLSDRWALAQGTARAELAAVTGTLAATLGGDDAPVLLERVVSRGARATGLHLALVDGRGRLVAASNPALEDLNPARLPARDGAAPVPATLGGEEHLLALATAPGGRYRVLALRPMAGVKAVYLPTARRTVVLVVLLWLIGVAACAGLAWYTARRTKARMRALAERLEVFAEDRGGDVHAVLERAARDLGAYAAPCEALADALRAARAETAEAKSHTAALLQINPHYVLLCTLDGQIVDANPAFYAISGLPFEAVRGNRIEVLEEVMPVEPLFELARRSFSESASIGSIEYALVNRDDVRRPVQVSLRGVHVGGKEAVVIQATDVANQRNLEQQVASFSDALDLMVDQRVAQLTAGSASVSRLLDEAGIAVVSFDEHGSTRRWSRAAEIFTGRQLAHVPHFTAFSSVLGLSPEARAAFSAWFWDVGAGTMTLDVFSTDGTPRRLLWRKTVARGAGSADRRVLVGVEVNAGGDPSGDGMSTFALDLEGMELAPGV